jgi:NAD(P)H-hydrate epimerase
MTDDSMKLYTAGQVQRLDACAIGEHGIDGYALMNRAGRAVLEAARARFPDTRHWLVLCGAGNNGGDGYVIARLARELGVAVTLYALKAADGLSGDAATAARDFLDGGGEALPWPPDSGADFDLVIDALLGTGLDRETGGRYRDAIEFANRSHVPVVAVDIPSGLHADTGCRMGSTIHAALTVSFIGAKRGLYTADGPEQCGEIVFDALDTPAEIHDTIANCGSLIGERFIAGHLGRRPRNSHKGHFGHVLVVGGNQGMGGAVRLAGEAALRSGAGLVSVATHPAHASVLNLSRPELMVSAVSEASHLQTQLKRASVIAAGPGMGQDSWAEELLQVCLGGSMPLVVDADGLNLLARAPASREHWILTPHPAEAARLLGSTTRAVQADRVGAAQAIAAKYTAVVVLKGCGTVVANPLGSYSICAAGNPGMATGGSGDVLTGVIAGLLGQGLDTWAAAQAGVVAHALAGDRAAGGGERGLLASDISRELPRVLNPAAE